MTSLLRAARRTWIWWLPLLAAVTAWTVFHAATRNTSAGYSVW